MSDLPPPTVGVPDLQPSGRLQRFRSRFSRFRGTRLLLFGGLISLGVVLALTIGPKPGVQPAAPAAIAGEPRFDPATRPRGFTLEIPSLTLTVPIMARVSGTNEREYLAALEYGVAQFDGSVNPDQDGNLFIFGHSDYYKRKPGDFKQVFRHLDQLKPDDRLAVTFQDVPYQYSVVRSSIVAADDWSITRPTIDGATRTLTLMTCWPPGTLEKRYAVIAQQLPMADTPPN